MPAGEILLFMWLSNLPSHKYHSNNFRCAVVVINKNTTHNYMLQQFYWQSNLNHIMNTSFYLFFFSIWWYYNLLQNCSTEEASVRTRRDIALSHTVSYGPIKRREVHTDKSTLSKLYLHINVYSSLEVHAIRSLCQYLFILSNNKQLGSRCKNPPSGDLCSWRSVGGSAAHHWCVWEAMGQKQTVLSNSRGPTHPVQHP